MSRRVASTSSGGSDKHEHGDDHAHTHSHGAATAVKKHKHAAGGCDHDHDHGGLFHTHAHDHSEGAEQIMKALSAGKLDRGTRITLLGACSVKCSQPRQGGRANVQASVAMSL
jgi:hypothetical protein